MNRVFELGRFDFLIVLILCGALSVRSGTTPSPQEINNSLTNSINELPESASDVDNTVHKKFLSISGILNFYNTEILADKFDAVKLGLTNSCASNVESYVEGLTNNENWAQKMDDASGRYHTGWFWGNHYWTGSQSLCENIVPKGYKFDNNEAETNNTRIRRDIQAARKSVSPSQSKGYKAGGLRYTSPPPFPVSFFMVNININSTMRSEEMTVHVGLCLPFICTDEDVKTIVEETSKAAADVIVRVDSIRSPHHYYNIWKDDTFIVLCVVTGVVCIFLAIGTGYDLYLENKEDQKQRLTLKCTTYTDPEHKLSDKTIKLDVSDIHTKNGKCCLYVVNNNNNNVEPSAEICMEPKLQEKEDSLVVEIIKHITLSFSIRLNIKTICDRTVGSDTIATIHGMKVISMVWVILGHTCIIAFKYSDNMEYRKAVQKEFFLQTITNGAFSVDTFFFTSGLLVSFLYFRTNAKGKLDTLGKKGFLSGCLHFGGLILYRFARLSVPYLFVLGLVEVCMKWFNYNSIFEPPTMDHVNCPKYWWRNILYINTLFPVEQMCMLWSWYLSDDTQFYALGAVLLIVGVRYFKSATVAMSVFLLSSWLTTGYVALSNSHMPSTDDPLALFDQIYDKPYTRLGPYLIGMAAGWLLFRTNCRIEMSRLAVIVGWLASSACLLSILYGLYEVDLTPIAGAAYSSLSHSAWALGLAWIIVACATGHGGFINGILSATIFYPISRITYCVYLLHPLVMRVMVMNMDSPLHLGKPLIITIFFGQVLASYAIGFVVSVVYEAPIVSMLKILPKLVQKKPQRVPA